MATGSGEVNDSLNETITDGNTTLVFEKTCSNIMTVPISNTNVGFELKEVQSCGGYYTTDGGDPDGWNPQLPASRRHPDLCIYECGFCDPEYDDCYGKKYCRVLCDDGALCDRSLGVMQPMHCKDVVCGTNNTCVKFDPIPCSVHERSFHQFMTGVYVCLFVFGGLIYLLQKNVCIPNKSWMADSNPALWFFLAVIPGGFYAVISGIFLGVCGTAGGTGWSVAGARVITMSIFMFIFYFYLIMQFVKLSENEGGKDDNSKAANGMAAMVWSMFFIADVMLSVINWKQTLFWVSETDIWPHLASNKRCGETENLYYVGWTTLMGFVSFFIICILNSVAADVDAEKASIYGKYVGATSLLFMLINISFLGACKSNGKTIIYEYGITICVFYGLLLALQLYTNVQVKNAQKRGEAWVPKFTTGSKKDVELSGVATGDVVIGNDGIPLDPSSSTASGSKFCNTRTIALLINFLIFALNGWSGYVVHSQVSALKPTIMG